MIQAIKLDTGHVCDPPRSDLDGSDVCVAIHSALRKVCDSKITSAAYNLIQLIETPPQLEKLNPWILLGKSVADHLADGIDPAKALRLAVGGLGDTYYEALDTMSSRRDDRGNTGDQLRALTCTFQCFTNDDYECAAAYLYDDEEEADDNGDDNGDDKEDERDGS